MNMPQGYDPILLFHWLWWRLLCLEADGTAFEALFRKVMDRTEPDFLPVRPYGNIGDRKCDGLLFSSGTVFQVFSPDEMTQAKAIEKLQEDFAGALEHWGEEFHRWVFVYNVRRGVPPDLAKEFMTLTTQHPEIEFDRMDGTELWDRIRELSLQERCEILGAPAGYEHLFLAPAALPDDVRGTLENGRFVLIQDIMTPVNVMDAINAIAPGDSFGPPLYVRPSTGEGWEEAARFQKALVEEAIERSKDLLPRFAVFSLSPIPLAIHLGHLLSDRVEVELFQYDRDEKTWAWPTGVEEGESTFSVVGLPKKETMEPRDAVIRVSLSATVLPLDTREITGEGLVEVDLSVSEPDVMWLRHPDQLTEFGRVFRSTVNRLVALMPRCRRIHLFYAGPTGGAIVLGQAINPRMTPPIALYEFNRRQSPSYENVLTLE